jgi:hypothetical protein
VYKTVADDYLILSQRGGPERETTGILMWSKLYLLRNSEDQEVAVALMDTQVEMIETTGILM